MEHSIQIHRFPVLDSLDPSLQKAIVNLLKLLLGMNESIHLNGEFKDVGKGQQSLCSQNTFIVMFTRARLGG